MSEAAIVEQVRALERLDLNQLRQEWRRRWGPPPKLRSAAMLRYMIAWRVQAAAFGGIEPAVRSKLVASDSDLPAIALDPGTRLAREWKGRRYEVEVVEDGFLYAGGHYRSLSEVARTITATRWNGLRFFGLRNGGAV